jgi:acyl carrier protein
MRLGNEIDEWLEPTIMGTPPAPDIRQSVSEIVRTVLERDHIEPSVDLFDQGVTSLAFIRIIAQINEKYDIALDVAELEEANIDFLSVLVGNQISTGSSTSERTAQESHRR